MDESKLEEILMPVSVYKAAQNEETVRKQFWAKFRSFAVRLPFAEDVAAAYFCATDNSTPLRVRGTLLAALAYFILPMDMVPDILAVVGFTDDIAVFTAALTMVQNHVTDEHRAKAKEAMATNDQPRPDSRP